MKIKWTSYKIVFSSSSFFLCLIGISFFFQLYFSLTIILEDWMFTKIFKLLPIKWATLSANYFYLCIFLKSQNNFQISYILNDFTLKTILFTLPMTSVRRHRVNLISTNDDKRTLTKRISSIRKQTKKQLTRN